MGVHGLWQLLKPTGKPVTLESLEGKVLAVDISIWLHQAVRGMRDADGNLVNNAHLVTLLHRICKLLYFRIKPIFVFDGSVPELKRRTMAARRKRKDFALDKSSQASEQILRNYMKVHAVDTVLGKKQRIKKRKVASVGNKEDTVPNMYILPPMPDSTEERLREEDEDDIWNEHQHHRSWLAEHYQEIDSIDIQSEDFNGLPPEIQYELIEEFLEKNKHNSWAKKNLLPKEANDFSDFQLSKLLNKSKLNQRLVNIREEMSRRSSGEIASILDLETKSIEARRIVSEDTQHYILVKTQKQKTPQEDVEDEFKPSGSKGNMDVEDVGRSTKSLWNVDSTKEKESSKQPITAKDLENAIQTIFDNQKEKMKNLSKSSETSMVTNVPVDLLEVTKVPSKDNHDPDNPKSDIELLETDKELGGAINYQNTITSSASMTTHNVDAVDLTEEAAAQEKGSLFDGDENREIEMENQSASDVDKYRIPSATSSASDSHVVDVIDLTEETGQDENKDDKEFVTQSNNSIVTDVEKNGIVEHQSTSVLENLETQTLRNTSEIDLQQNDEPEDEDGLNKISSRKHDEGSESEGGFIEVLFDPTQVSGNDELFPAEIFMQANPNDTSTNECAAVPDYRATNVGAVPDYRTTNEGAVPDYRTTSESAVPDYRTTSEDGAVQSNTNREQIIELGHKEEEMMAAMSKEREKSLNDWKDMNTNDVSEMEDALAQERATLQTERQRQQRIGASITDQMYAESKELLELFGIPYIVSPQEAEAQCAYLDICDQTHGSITDDSDVWLFGGHRVYKNFFSKDKDVDFYESGNFESELFLDRTKLICMALLLGCDYTDGIDGVGCITAMEILSEFPGKGIDGLRDFRAWWDANVGNLNPPVETKIKSQLRKLDLPSTFPADGVMEAFLSPQVEKSAEEFTWGIPDLDSIRGFALERLSWNTKKTDENLLPVLKRMNEKNIQRPISSYFGTVATGQKTAVQSKRLKRVLKKFQHGPSDEEDKPSKNKGVKRKTSSVNKKAPQRKGKGTDDGNSGKTKTDPQSKQKMEPKDDRRRRGAKVVRYMEEIDSDDMSMDGKSTERTSSNPVEWKGPNLSESGSSSEDG